MLLREVFVRKLFQRDGRDRGVGFVAFEGGIGDKGRDVFLEFGKVLDDVVLGEVDTVIVVHFLGNTEEEFASLEHVHHYGNVLLNLLESLFGVLRLILVIGDLGKKHLNLICERFLKVKLAHIGKLASLNNLLNLILDILVGLL